MDNEKIYENFRWEDLKQIHLKPKIEKIIETIPEDVETILDIGCGNGVITNALGKIYDITGIDRSENALSFVNAKKILASSDNIPLESQTFDMVFSSELLEHLENEVLENTIHEIKRLSKQYIFITVPNGENPDKLAIKCPKCKMLFNKPNHLRSIDHEKCKSYFQEYEVVKHYTLGNKVRYYNRKILKSKIKLSPSSSWIPYYWIPKNNRRTICPCCEHEFTYAFRFNIIAFAHDILNVIISPKKPYWLFILFETKKT